MTHSNNHIHYITIDRKNQLLFFNFSKNGDFFKIVVLTSDVLRNLRLPKFQFVLVDKTLYV